ncbi:hypothetical protein [Rhodoferax sp. BAB1]|uniref:hypothetical protein n=1 Tax=Rhodoferax sp. BAB1 TaxID=2741720 RepID=UPI00157557A4|nr:hypothetical protein [Rhodoferax sp. BAB1]QKO23612.1 hypothetical protein HTY51_17760 [Rhodoferax sp. BAB1]
MEHQQAEQAPRPPATDAETAWHDTLAAMSAVLQDCLQAPRAAPSREIERAEAALREYTRRLRQEKQLAEAEL